MDARRTPHGEIVLDQLPAVCAEALRSLPEVLESDDPRVRDRLLPRAYEDDELEAEWRRIGVPELEHLFAASSRLIEKDLHSLRRSGDGSFKLVLRPEHENAWLSGLNAARHAIFILNDLEPDDMEKDPDELATPNQALALYQIHLLAWVQELIMRSGDPLGGGMED
jgi:hypothetical protein